MAYEIPSSLQYEEKMIAGLTFRQVVCLGVPGLASMAIFKSSLPVALKGGFIAVAMALGAVFAFSGIEEKLLNMALYYAAPRRMGLLDQKMAGFIGVKEIRADTMFLSNGEKRAILQVKPINFMIKSAEDKESIVASFQKFLNSLGFPVQILIRTVNMKLDSYLNDLKESVGKEIEETKNEDLQKLFEDYCEFLHAYIEKNAVKNRLFYIVIPAPRVKAPKEKKEAEELEQLEIRANICREGLASMGIASERLSTERLVSLLSSFFEGYIEVDNNYLFPVTMLKDFEEGWYESNENAEEKE